MTSGDSNIFGYNRGQSSGNVDSQPEVRPFMRVLGRPRIIPDNLIGTQRGKNPFDEISVVRNDLKSADLDLVPVESATKNKWWRHTQSLKPIFSPIWRKLEDLAEHRMLRGAVSGLNQMLTATRSFFW